MKKALFIEVFLLINATLGYVNLYAEDKANSYVIDQVIYEIIDGNTSEHALRALSKLESGMVFPDYASLVQMVENEKQALINRRYFHKVSADIKKTFTTDSDNTDSTIQRYSVTFTIVDAFTITPIPYPKYDSNTGLRLGMKLYWDNFLGSMTDAYLGTNMDIRLDEASTKKRIGEWNIVTSISGIRFYKGVLLSASLSQSHKEEDFVDSVDPTNSYSFTYDSTEAKLSTSFDLRKSRAYTVSLGTVFRYNYQGELGSHPKYLNSLLPTHGFNFARLDWINNFREGFSTGISNNFSFGTDANNEFLFSTSINISGSYYKTLWKRFNFYTRAMTFYQWGEPRRIASSLRGVRNNLMSGYTGAVLNTSLAFMFWRFEDVWDAQIHPFVDIGIVYNNESFDAVRDFNVGGGFDLVLFLDALPSLVARGSVGIDARRFDSSDLFASLEISITSTLHY